MAAAAPGSTSPKLQVLRRECPAHGYCISLVLDFSFSGWHVPGYFHSTKKLSPADRLVSFQFGVCVCGSLEWGDL